MLAICRSGGSSIQPRSGRLASQRGADRVQVDQDGGPDGLEFGFAAAAVAAGAGVLAIGHQAEQPLDAWSGALEVLVLDGVGERLQCGLAEVFAATDANLAPGAGSAARPQRAGLAVGR